MINRILLFGDTHGLFTLLIVFFKDMVCGIVAAGMRP